MKKTNKELMFKSFKYFAYTVLLMFTAPVVVYSAFKNQTHPWYWPVFIFGIILCIAAIVMGFYSLRLIMRSLFGKKE